MCENSIIKGVFRQVTSNKVTNYYNLKIKTIIEIYLKIKRGKAYADKGILVKYEKRKKFLGFHLGSYVYNNNSKLNSEAKKIFDSNRNSLNFKKAISLCDNKIIGALFCSKNYMAMEHHDDDRSK